MTSLKEDNGTDFLNLVTLFSSHYNRYGTLLTADAASEQYGVPTTLVTKALADDDFREALSERGITLERFSDDWTAKSLTPSQLLVANAMLDYVDQRTHKKKLQDLGVNTQTYQAWLKDPVFKDYLQKRAEQVLGDAKHEVGMALMDKVRSGDVKAIAYYNEMMGIFTPQRATNQAFDTHGLIVKIIEIIDQHVTDEPTQLAIATDLKKLIAANNTASALIGTPLPVGALEVEPAVPEIMPTKHLGL